MKVFKIVSLWAFFIALSLSVYTFGLRGHYRYEAPDGAYFDETEYYGDDLSQAPGYELEGGRYRYTGKIMLFDKEPEARVMAIILFFGLAAFLTPRVVRKAILNPEQQRKGNDSQVAFSEGKGAVSMKDGLYVCLVAALFVAIYEAFWLGKSNLAVVLLALSLVSGYLCFCVLRILK